MTHQIEIAWDSARSPAYLDGEERAAAFTGAAEKVHQALPKVLQSIEDRCRRIIGESAE